MAPTLPPQVRPSLLKQAKPKSPTKSASDKSVDPPKGPQLDFNSTIELLHQNASVRDKVRKWQTTGAGVVTPDDPLAAVDSDMEEKAASRASVKSKSSDNVKLQIIEPPKIEIADPPASSPTKSATSEKAVPVPVPHIVERKPMHNKLDAEVREASAPKKRVVSDAHWRVKRAPPKDPAPKPARPDKKKEKDVQLAWVRAPLLPREPDEPPPPPKPKPQPKPIKVYAGRPRNKSFNNAVKPDAMFESEEELPRIRTPTTPRQRTPLRHSRATVEKSPRLVKSDEDTSPKRTRPSQQRRPSAKDDPFSSPEDHQTSKYSFGDMFSRKMSSRRRSLSPEGTGRRKPTMAQSPEFELSDGEYAAQRRRSRRERRSRDSDPTSQEETSPPLRRLSNHDEEAARRRTSFRDEYARYTPRETYSDRKRTPRKKPYISDPVESEYNDRTPDPIPVVAPKVYSHRIENWLTETPDPLKVPLGEAKSGRRAFSFEPQGRDMSVYTESTVDTESTITDVRDNYKGSPKKGSKHRHTASHSDASRGMREQSAPLDGLDPEIEVEYSSTTSVPSLRRSVAKHSSPSPTKEHTRLASPKQSAADSDGASSVDPSAFEPPDGVAAYAARRLFPSTGKRLSTIASVETFNTKAQQAPPSSISEGSECTASLPIRAKNDELSALPNIATASLVSSTRSKTSLRRKLTTHADLISVLSMPASRSKSIVSARSIRTHRSRLETATIDDLMKELTSDETKYMRELRTLADGVIPVLLKCVLSKSEAAVAAGLFNRFPNSEKDAVADASKAIHDMSVAIQRLKSVHKRIPKDSHFSFLIWAQSAHSVYEKFVKTWRLGFQDVVVSLAAEDEDSTVSTPKTSDSGAWDQGLPRNEDGYIVDGDGERVDVAFLLKRPLVRLKYLTKTLKGINIKKPSEQAGVLATKFEGLMDLARKRVNEEKARMEDEAASLIDTTRARDPKSLAPLSGVKIDPSRNVRARDYFDLSLPHSSGQQVDCRIEILMRDDAPGRGNSGDALICEVDETGRWLLFPPIQMSRISARAGDEPGEIVAMIQGVHSGGRSWQELLTLKTHDEEVRFEWIQMLGLSPVPPSLTSLDRNRSFKITVPLSESSYGSSLLSGSSRTESTTPIKSRTPSPRQIEVPIGERAGTKSKTWDHEESEVSGYTYSTVSSELSSLPDSEYATLHHKNKSPDRVSYDRASYSSYSSLSQSTYDQPEPRRRSEKVEPKRTPSEVSIPRSLNEAMDMAGSGSPALKRTRAKRYRSTPSSLAEPAGLSPNGSHRRGASLSPAGSPDLDRPRTSSDPKRQSKSPGDKGFSVWMPTSSEADGSDESDEERDALHKSTTSGRLELHRRTSSVPATKLPNVTKRSQPKESQSPQTPTRNDLRGASLPMPSPKDVPSSAPSKLQKRRSQEPEGDKPPPPPPHRTPSSNRVSFAPTPQFTPNSKVKRRSSSPLKHEYQPSSASSDSELSDSASEFSDDSLTSESEDELVDDDDVVSSLVPPSLTPRKKVDAPETIYSMPNATLTPSQSASQAPYRTVPQQTEKAAKTVATIFCWSDRGQWEILHPDECSILISPGLIEAYAVKAGEQVEGVPKERPLVALELTPLVPLRRGTALDITIRSPPTPASRLKPGNNIMFRSRSTEECEALYALINTSRINNPTYIALQSARPPTGENTWAAVMDRRNSNRGAAAPANNWWQFGGSSRSKSYRASTRAPSTAGNTESSVATISSVMAAMKRFSGSGRMFGKSSRDGASSGSMGSGGSGAHSPPTYVDPSKPGSAPPVPIGLGITNAKIRLYARQSQSSKWADLGAARLSIMQRDNQGINTPIMLQTGVEKRILVVGKSKAAEVMLDVTLGESCFERVARTGIAVSVWEDVVPEGHGGGVAATGGVAEKRVKIYMIQLKSERECAYTFSLLGKLRY
ncbi:hypothetical protein EJ08DRAFT_733731 [Tothia fuscella]|uniref:Uncharacterized protein n=1 Tax=Tothia fuscella TaxID=1048955 RepID=A0A9P4TYS0_9PEZI|nr:hypothetical protein EJ08DRAFT_733731 [Tothia fuscella]